MSSLTTTSSPAAATTKKRKDAEHEDSKDSSSASSNKLYSVMTTSADYRNGGQRATFSIFKLKSDAEKFQKKFDASWANEDGGEGEDYNYSELETIDLDAKPDEDGAIFNTRVNS